MSWIGSNIYLLRRLIREKVIKFRFEINIKNNIPVIVYQMGKVGSTSVYKSLKEIYPGIVLHRHSLSEHLDWQAQSLIKHSVKNKGALKLITLTREPVGRNISAFFQNFEEITGVNPNKSVYTLEEIKEIILSNPKQDNKTPLKWFDDNILKNFGINVFEEPFNKEKGWAILKKNSIELLIMKSEIDNGIKTSLIENFLGVNNLKLTIQNKSEDKSYSHLYLQFKNIIKLPSDYLEMLHSAPQVKHFYTNKEIEESQRKWTDFI